ncbi:hypothetical protein ABPG72_018959 [Tetrahymena utriculariae]
MKLRIFIQLLVLFIVFQVCSAYKRKQFDTCIANMCAVQQAFCSNDFQCSDNQLDYLYCIGSNTACQGTFPDDMFSSAIINCMKQCSVVSQNSNWINLQQCYLSCFSFKMSLFLGTLLISIFFIM